ncbi:MAG TPA: MoxR family ATPase [Candidatus Thermoplasmatota archaeon]|nr:MoxR family ATPase [Candidatus Thermoplasmatota archaeon]
METDFKVLKAAQKGTRSIANDVQWVSATCKRLIEEVAKVIVGKPHVLELVTVDVLTAGNILFEDFPGLAKSLMASTFSRASGSDFKRIQFTPDLLPADITGIYMYNQRTGEFEFRPGPVFTNFLLADEINRAPPKTQSALLETMQERQVTVEGNTHALAKPYIVLATQNPVEQEGTYPLPEAQMDRFLMKMSVGYPSRKEEVEILRRRMVRKKDDVDVKAVTTPEEIVKMQKIVEEIHTDDGIMEYIGEIVSRTREDPRMEVGSSPRGSLALFKASRSYAAVQGRDYVVPDDVKRILMPSMAHRMILKPEPKLKGVKTEDVLKKIIDEVPVPKT